MEKTSEDYSAEHQRLCGVMAMELRQTANQLDAGEIDCAMFMIIRKNLSVSYNLIDGKFFMAFESYMRNFVNRFGREAVEKALFPPIVAIPKTSRNGKQLSRRSR